MSSDSKDNGDEPREPVGIRITIPPSDRRFPGFVTPPVPDEFIPEFGRVATIWSAYESLFKKLLIALLRSTQHTDQRWRGQSYEQKANLLRDKLDEVFLGYPWIWTYISSTLDAAGQYQRERNLLLHGELFIRFGPVPHEPDSRICIIARGRRKKQEIEQNFTLRDLQNLYAGISYAAARLQMLGFPPDTLFTLFYQMVPPHGSLLDIFVLRDFLRNNYPYQSNRPTPADPPAPSQA